MVLSNSSSSSDPPPEIDAFSNNSPPSDVDPYSTSPPLPSSTSDYLSQTTIPSNFPRPFPIIGPLLGYDEKKIKLSALLNIRKAEAILKRPVTPEESTAFLFWTSKVISIASYGPPVGAIGGAWRAYSTRDRLRFPFYQPKLGDSFNPYVFPHATLPLLKGVRATMAWHGLRGVLYGSFGVAFSKMFFGSYSTSVAVLGSTSDPRLKDYLEAIITYRGNPSTARQATQRKIQGQVQPRQDNASPTSGLYGGEESNMGMNDESAQETESEWRPSAPARPSPVQSSVSETQHSPFDALGTFDDASPTDGQGLSADTKPPQTGSAWDRIRRTEAGGKQTSGTAGPRSWSQRQNEAKHEQQSASGNSFSFSKSEEERNYAREEAQKEFDANLEKERRGNDPSAVNGDQKRW